VNDAIWQQPIVAGIVVTAWGAVLGLITYGFRSVIAGQKRQDDKLDGLDRRLSVKESVDDERSRHTSERLAAIESSHAEFRGEVRFELGTIHRRVDDVAGATRRDA
jgi:hypothetical protein